MKQTQYRNRSRAMAKAQHDNFNRLAALAGFVGLALFVIVFLASAPVRAAQYPDCNAVPVEFKIVRDFNWAEKNTWRRGFEMVRLTRAHEHRTVKYSGSEVSRRYCMAKAHFSNGHHRNVYFMISDIGGFVGRNWDVTHCVEGLDPWRNHDGGCRTMR